VCGLWEVCIVNTRPQYTIYVYNNCCWGKALNIAYAECVFVSFFLPSMPRIILLSVSCSALIFFPTFSYKQYDFQKKKLLNVKRMFWYPLQHLSEIFLIVRRTRWDILKMCTGLHIKNPLFLSAINQTWSLSTDFGEEILKYTILRKYVQCTLSYFMRTEGRTDGNIWHSWYSIFAILRTRLRGLTFRNWRALTRETTVVMSKLPHHINT
jgi:hypothetical protein